MSAVALPKIKAMTIKQLRDEVLYWRTDAAAGIEMAGALHKSAVARGDQEKAADIYVMKLLPMIAAWKAVAAGSLWMKCCECGADLRPGVPTSVFYEDETTCAACHPEAPADAEPTPLDDEATVSRVLAALDSRFDEVAA